MSCPCSSGGTSSTTDSTSSSTAPSLVKNVNTTTTASTANNNTKKKRRTSSFQDAGDSILKFCLCGQASVGKTSLARRYVYGVVNQTMRPTIGLDFLTKSIVVDGNCITVQLFDLQGQDLGGKTKATTSFYYRGSRGIIVVCDASMLMGSSGGEDGDTDDGAGEYNAKKAMDEVASWKKDVDEKLHNGQSSHQNNQNDDDDEEEEDDDDERVPVFLLVNKIDLPETKLEMDLVKRRAEKLKVSCGFDQVFLVSAVTGALVQQSFYELVEAAMK